MKTTALAHVYWTRFVKKGDHVIDATVGGGYDLQFLARLVGSEGSVVGYDIQEEALLKAEKRLSDAERAIVTLHHRSHASFLESGAKLIVYNLGYLPGGNKALTTMTKTTLQSLESASQILEKGGAISITCYPGHEEGKKEEEAVMDFVKMLPQEHWSTICHSFPMRHKAPSLLLLMREVVGVEKIESLLTSPRTT